MSLEPLESDLNKLKRYLTATANVPPSAGSPPQAAFLHAAGVTSKTLDLLHESGEDPTADTLEGVRLRARILQYLLSEMYEAATSRSEGASNRAGRKLLASVYSELSGRLHLPPR